MKKSLVTAALAGSLLVTPVAPAQATTTFGECLPPLLHHHVIMDCAFWAINTACDIVMPDRPCGWNNRADA